MKQTSTLAIPLCQTMVIATCISFGTAAYAGFNNGGFETGDLSGWDIQYGNNNGVSDLSDPTESVNWGGWSYPYNGTEAGVVAKGTSDGYLPALNGLITGQYAARLNDLNGMYHVTQISQTGVIDDSDLFGGATQADLYINWAGVMDDPGHDQANEPWFVIEVYKNGSLFGTEIQYANTAAGGGWVQTGVYGWDAVWAKSGQFHLTGLDVGDSVMVNLTVADCGYGGHGAYAYLDGIGTAYVPPPPDPDDPTVPDVGTTALLLVPALGVLGALRRRIG